MDINNQSPRKEQGAYQSAVMKTMAERGFVYQATNSQALDQQLLQSNVMAAYVGFDATADSLHVGNLMQIMRMKLWQNMGHKPIILIGGATTKIGDPSGKNSMRKLLNDEQIAENIQGILKILKKYISFGNKSNDALLVNNMQWLDNIKFLDILRLVGPHFSVNKMVSFDSVKNRLDAQQHLSFLEFNYMVLQAYDFLHLYNEYNCTLQMGGADQWGNIVCGVDLVRRLKAVEVFGLTCELLTTANGSKMGKTAQGAVWLDENKLSPFDYWQFWRNTDDRDVIKFLKLFTELTIEQIEALPMEEGSDINNAKILLANEATKIAHGEKAALSACQAASCVSNISLNNDPSIDSGLPQIYLPKDTTDYSVINLLLIAKLCNSKGEAKRAIKGKAIRINGQTIIDENKILKPLAKDENIIISFGKKRHIQLKG